MQEKKWFERKSTSLTNLSISFTIDPDFWTKTSLLTIPTVSICVTSYAHCKGTKYFFLQFLTSTIISFLFVALQIVKLGMLIFFTKCQLYSMIFVGNLMHILQHSVCDFYLEFQTLHWHFFSVWQHNGLCFIGALSVFLLPSSLRQILPSRLFFP